MDLQDNGGSDGARDDRNVGTNDSLLAPAVADSCAVTVLPQDDEISYKFGSRDRTHKGVRRYQQGLKNLVPVRCMKTPENTLPLETNGFINYITFGWLTPYMWQVFRHGAASVRALRITKEESAQVSSERMERFWEEELGTKGAAAASFGSAIFRSFKTRIIIGAFASLVYAFLSLANPILVIRYFLTYLSEETVTIRSGIVYAACLGLILLLRGLTGAFFWMVNYEAAARIKYGSLALLYKKILHLKTLKDKTVGDMVNLISNDGQRIWDGIIMGPFLIGAPMIVVISCVYSVVFLGPWALISFIIILGFYPFAMSLAKLSQNYRENSIKITDQRVGLMNELLTSIKLIKMYAWESSFANKISDIRSDEKSILEKSVFVQSVSMGSSMLVPIFASCLMFIAYVATGHNLTAMEAFTFVSLLNTMQSSMATIPFALKALSEMVVTTRRFQEILLMDEINSLPLPTSSNIAVEMNSASLTWTQAHSKKDMCNGTVAKSKKKKKKKEKKDEEDESLNDNVETEGGNKIFTGPTLQDITFSLKKGQLLGVCGNIGSGKSSLLSAILGRMDVASGSVAVAGGVAYVPQQAWVTNDTVKDNIIFGHEFDAARYKQVINACGLTDDFQCLPHGDVTEVGERGANLSGGQKQRISLARAAYSKCDLVLLDDPLSAVDVHIGQHIFQHCIMGLLKGRTVVFVTHHLEYLKYCDEILVMRDGAVVEKGTHDFILSNGKEYANLLSLYKVNHEESGDRKTERKKLRNGDMVKTPDVIPDDNSNSLGHGDHDDRTKSNHTDTGLNRVIKGAEKLIKEEEMDSGSLKFYVVHQYIKSLGGYVALFFIFICFCLPVAGVTTASWYLSYWLEQGNGNSSGRVGPDNQTVLETRVIDNPNLNNYLLVYAGFIPLLILVTLLRSFCIMKASLRASSNLHDRGFVHIIRCSMSFFETTPIGRIINRFSADLDEMDVRLPMNVEIFLTNVLQVLAAIAMIGYVSPWFLLAVVPLGMLFFLLMIIFHVCVCELKCLDNVTRSPVISHMTASIQGLACIHAYHKSQQFMQKHFELLNTNSVAVFLFHSSNRWLALRLDLVCSGVAFLTGLLVLATYDYLNPALAGLALSFALQLSGLFQFTARLAVETEARFTAVQRVLEYCDVEEPDPSKPVVSGQVPPDWPKSADLQFNNVKLRYREGAPLALKGVTFRAEPGQKIGIVGRTGAGKSSLTVALFRLVELESGQIFIDGVDISKLPVEDLRSRLSIIPQDPVLFAGTIRYNLDPFDKYTDAQIWQALDKCHISSMVKSLDGQLETNIVENGDNFSVGEKQLLCMARALLRNSKVLILDEATAAIDTETDALIQSTLHDAFSQCTMLIIAHRLNTVRSCDKILVLDEGMMKEFDTPASLLNSDSKFKEMWEATLDS